MLLPMNSSSAGSSDSVISNSGTLFAGPSLLGVVLTWALFGVLVVQIYLYYTAFPRDRLWVKATVYGLFLIECLQNGASLQTAWYYCITISGGEDGKVSWGIRIIPIINGIVCLWVQVFFAWRIVVLGRRHPLWIVVITLILLSASGQAGAGGFVTVELFTRDKALLEWSNLDIWAIPLQQYGSLGGDVIITISMLILFSKARRDARLVFPYTQSMSGLSRFIQITIESGALTTLVVGGGVGLVYGMRNNLLFLISTSIQGKLYAISLLANLNARSRFLVERHWESEEGADEDEVVEVEGDSKSMSLYTATTLPRQNYNNSNLNGATLTSAPSRRGRRSRGASTEFFESRSTDDAHIPQLALPPSIFQYASPSQTSLALSEYTPHIVTGGGSSIHSRDREGTLTRTPTTRRHASPIPIPSPASRFST